MVRVLVCYFRIEYEGRERWCFFVCLGWLLVIMGAKRVGKNNKETLNMDYIQ
jgi:hypothetical protein